VQFFKKIRPKQYLFFSRGERNEERGERGNVFLLRPLRQIHWVRCVKFLVS